MGARATLSRVAPNAATVPAMQALGAVRPFAPEGKRAPAAPEGWRGPAFSFGKLSIEAKLTVGQPGDKLEEEADQVADRVMWMPDSAAGSVLQREGGQGEDDGARVQRKTEQTRAEPMVQRRGGPEPRTVHAALYHPSEQCRRGCAACGGAGLQLRQDSTPRRADDRPAGPPASAEVRRMRGRGAPAQGGAERCPRGCGAADCR